MSVTREDIERAIAGGNRVLEQLKRVCPKPVEASSADEYESHLHDLIIDECRARGWYFVHSRLDRRTTNARGTPDFIIAKSNGKTLWLEAKRRGKKATVEQVAAIAQLRKHGHAAYVVDNWTDTLTLLDLG